MKNEMDVQRLCSISDKSPLRTLMAGGGGTVPETAVQKWALKLVSISSSVPALMT